LKTLSTKLQSCGNYYNNRQRRTKTSRLTNKTAQERFWAKHATKETVMQTLQIYTDKASRIVVAINNAIAQYVQDDKNRAVLANESHALADNVVWYRWVVKEVNGEKPIEVLATATDAGVFIRFETNENNTTIISGVEKAIALTSYKEPLPIADVYNAVKQLADSYPDFTYAPQASLGCKYTQGGDAKHPILCGCIIGQALMLSVHREVRPAMSAYLAYMDRRGQCGCNELMQNFSEVHLQSPVVLRPMETAEETGIALAKIVAVQAKQDNALSWAEAVAESEEDYHVSMLIVSRAETLARQLVADRETRRANQQA
jgi:hypothetical protein